MKFSSLYNLGEIVYLRFGEERGMVTAVTFIPGSSIYTITWSDGSSGEHFSAEFTNDPNERFQLLGNGS